MERLKAAALVAAVLTISGCGGSGYGTVGSTNTSSGNGNPTGSTPVTKAQTAALFQPLAGILPFPTDLYFAGSTDGTLNIQPANALMPNQAALNALDGFSTTAVIRTRFGGAIDAASLMASSVIMVEITTSNTTKAPAGLVKPLVFGTDFTANVAAEDSTILEIRPLHPLAPSTCISNGAFLGAKCTTGTGYLVFLTSGITVGGAAATPDTDYANILAALPSGCATITNTTLNAICQLTGAHMQFASPLHVDPKSVVLSFSFTTQSTFDTMAAVGATAAAHPQKITVVHPPGFTTHQVNAALPGLADVYVGTMQLPYYLSRTSPLTEYWHAPPFPLDTTSTFTTRFNPLPVATETLTVPVLMTVPNTIAKPTGGWPIVIFQHGITGDRTNMLAIADAFASKGFAVVAIDLPLHGVTSTTNPFYAAKANPLYGALSLPATGSIERTFDLDVMNNTTGAAGADGVIDGSGLHFINLASLLTSRDNLREAAADLATLASSVAQIDLNADGVADINASSVHFVGHSLGAITGTTFLAISTVPGTATLAMPGGGVASLLRNSPTFGPTIIAGLQAQGLQQGTTLFEQFFRDAQTVVDAGDPWNFIAAAAAIHPIHVIQVVGDGTATHPPDQVIPNFATQRLIDAGGLAKVSPPGGASATGVRGYVNFTAGTHSSILDPTASAAATGEMQTEAVAFALLNGLQLPVTQGAPVQ